LPVVNGSVAFAGGFLLVMTASLFFTSVRELLVRNKRKRALGELSNTPNTKELIDDKDVPSASVTESTTRGLDGRVRVKRRE
jgi:hypothetical protein